MPEVYTDSVSDRARDFVWAKFPNGRFYPEDKSAIAATCAEFVGQQSPKAESGEAQYLDAVDRFRFFLSAWDTLMNTSRNMRASHAAVAFALGLASTSGKCQTEVAAMASVSPANLSKNVTEFLRMVGLEGSFSCKSSAAKKSYSECERRPHKARAGI